MNDEFKLSNARNMLGTLAAEADSKARFRQRRRWLRINAYVLKQKSPPDTATINITTACNSG